MLTEVKILLENFILPGSSCSHSFSKTKNLTSIPHVKMNETLVKLEEKKELKNEKRKEVRTKSKLSLSAVLTALTDTIKMIRGIRTTARFEGQLLLNRQDLELQMVVCSSLPSPSMGMSL